MNWMVYKGSFGMTLEEASAGWEGAVVPVGGEDGWIPKDCCPEGAGDGWEGVPAGAPLPAAFVAAVEGPEPVGADI